MTAGMLPQGIELSRGLSEVESLETRLAEMWNQSQSTFITEAIALQMVQLHIQQQLNSAKQEWLKLVRGHWDNHQGLAGEVTMGQYCTSL